MGHKMYRDSGQRHKTTTENLYSCHKQDNCEVIFSGCIAIDAAATAFHQKFQI